MYVATHRVYVATHRVYVATHRVCVATHRVYVATHRVCIVTHRVYIRSGSHGVCIMECASTLHIGMTVRFSNVIPILVQHTCHTSTVL